MSRKLTVGTVELSEEQYQLLDAVQSFRGLGTSTGNIVRALDNKGRAALVSVLFAILDAEKATTSAPQPEGGKPSKA